MAHHLCHRQVRTTHGTKQVFATTGTGFILGNGVFLTNVGSKVPKNGNKESQIGVMDNAVEDLKGKHEWRWCHGPGWIIVGSQNGVEEKRHREVNERNGKELLIGTD